MVLLIVRGRNVGRFLPFWLCLFQSSGRIVHRRGFREKPIGQALSDAGVNCSHVNFLRIGFQRLNDIVIELNERSRAMRKPSFLVVLVQLSALPTRDRPVRTFCIRR